MSEALGGPYYSYTDISPTHRGQCCAWTHRVGLIMITGYALQQKHQGTLRRKVYSDSCWVHSTLVGHAARSRGQRKGRIGALPLFGSECGVSRLFQIHSLLVNLKNQSGNQCAVREKWGHMSGPLSKLPRTF